MKIVKHFFQLSLVFLIIFLTGCAGQRYHKRAGEGRPISGPSGAVSQGFQWPLQGRVVTPFGAKEDGVSLKGIVVEGSEGQEVRASRDGSVALVDEALRGYGKTLILEHDSVFSTVYARNSEILVSAGQWVRQGQAIARVGRAGKGGVPRAYFEIRKMAKPEDPQTYLR